MAWRHAPRVVAHGLTVTLAELPDMSVTVLDISEDGMLLDVGDAALEPGSTVEFVLKTGELHGSGRGRVVDCRDGAVGIAVESWHGMLGDAVRRMIEQALLADSTWRELYLDPPARPRPPLVAR